MLENLTYQYYRIILLDKLVDAGTKTVTDSRALQLQLIRVLSKEC